MTGCRGQCRKLRGGEKRRGTSPYENSCYCTICDKYIDRRELLDTPENKRSKCCPCCFGFQLRGLHKKRMDNFGVERISAR